jgi:hypothetical protein
MESLLYNLHRLVPYLSNHISTGGAGALQPSDLARSICMQGLVPAWTRWSPGGSSWGSSSCFTVSPDAQAPALKNDRTGPGALAARAQEGALHLVEYSHLSGMEITSAFTAPDFPDKLAGATEHVGGQASGRWDGNTSCVARRWRELDRLAIALSICSLTALTLKLVPAGCCDYDRSGIEARGQA